MGRNRRHTEPYGATWRHQFERAIHRLHKNNAVSDQFTGESFAQWVRTRWPKLEVEVVKRPDATPGFTVLPRRWIVERTFGWLMRHRRLVRDYERTETSAESWIHLAMIRIQLRRLA